MGHNAADCRGKTKCVVCAGPHRLRDCPGKVNKEIVVVPKCANCGEGHTASYGGCTKIKFAKKVEQVRSSQRMSYRDAVNAIKKQIPASVRPKDTASNSNRRNITSN